MTVRRTLTALAVALVLVTSACGDDGRDVPAEAKAFCDEMDRVGGGQPQGYAGSAEHIADIEALVEVAPDDVRDELERYRDALTAQQAHGVDPATADAAPDPDAVQADIDAVQEYADTTC